MAEYVLNQVASEVQQAINKALSSVQTVNGVSPDENGNVEVEISEGCFTAAAQDLLMTVLRNGVYTSDQSANLDALEEALKTSGGGSDEPHAHSYASVVTKEATCETAGVRTYTCACGDTYTEEISATGHNYVDGVCANCGRERENATISVDEFIVAAISPHTYANNLPGTAYNDSTNSARLSYVGTAVVVEAGETYTVTPLYSVENPNLKYGVQYAHKETVDKLYYVKQKEDSGWLTSESYTFIPEYDAYLWVTFANTSGVDKVDATKIVGVNVELDAPDEPDVPDEPEVTLTSISATYSGGDVTAGTAVDGLTGIVVTAHYSDGTSATVTGYTLSGTIAEGSNTVTVSYGGKTTTFTVTGEISDTDAWVDGKFYFNLVQGQIYYTAVNGYTAPNNARVSYVGTNCSLTPGKSYRLVGVDGVRYGVQTVTNSGYEKIQSGTDIENTTSGGSCLDKLDSGWQASGYEFVADDAAVCAWVTASFSSGDITPQQAMPVYLEVVETSNEYEEV